MKSIARTLVWCALAAVMLALYLCAYGDGVVKHAVLPECVREVCAAGGDLVWMRLGEDRLICYNTGNKSVQRTLTLDVDWNSEIGAAVHRSDVLTYGDFLAISFFSGTTVKVRICRIASAEDVGDFAFAGIEDLRMVGQLRAVSVLLYCDAKTFVLCFAGYVYVYDMAARKVLLTRKTLPALSAVWESSLYVVDGAAVRKVFDLGTFKPSDDVLYSAKPGKSICVEAIPECMIVYEATGVIAWDSVFDIQVIDPKGTACARTEQERLIRPFSVRGAQAVHFLSDGTGTPLALSPKTLEFSRWKVCLAVLLAPFGDLLLTNWGDNLAVINEADAAIICEVPEKCAGCGNWFSCSWFCSSGICVFGKELHWVEDVAKALAREKAMVRAPGVQFSSWPTQTTLTANYEYDAKGRVTSSSDFQGKTCAYQYDDAAIQAQITENTRVHVYSYSQTGKVKSKQLANGSTENFNYDADDEMYYQEVVASDSTVLGFASYSRDDNGRITSDTAIGCFGSYQTTYGFDAVGNMTGETRTGTNSYTKTYSFDGMHDRTQKVENGNTTTYNYNGLGRITTSTAGFTTTFSYDNNGNLTSKSGNGVTDSFAFDWKNNLVHYGNSSSG